MGVVLAGGTSSRFGGAPKGLAMLAGRAMALHVAAILRAACSTVVIEAPQDSTYEALGLPLIHAAPEHAGKGPLAALAAGLAGAEAEDNIAFAPCDMPLLAPEIFLALARAGGAGAYARTSIGVEPLVAVLSGRMRAVLLTTLEQELLPRTHIVLDCAGAHGVDFADAAPFANVNTPKDLAHIKAILSARA